MSSHCAFGISGFSASFLLSSSAGCSTPLFLACCCRSVRTKSVAAMGIHTSYHMKASCCSLRALLPAVGPPGETFLTTRVRLTMHLASGCFRSADTPMLRGSLLRWASGVMSSLSLPRIASRRSRLESRCCPAAIELKRRRSVFGHTIFR